jgi:hypothetical protein
MIYSNQVAPGRAQINANNPNSKTQTNDPSTIAPNDITPGSSGFTMRYAIIVVNVLVIEY